RHVLPRPNNPRSGEKTCRSGLTKTIEAPPNPAKTLREKRVHGHDGDRGSSNGSCANHPLGLMQRVEPPTQVKDHSTCQTGYTLLQAFGFHKVTLSQW